MSGSKAFSSPGSTATSKLKPVWQNKDLASSPALQTPSESGSTGTEYMTPPSTIQPWRDVVADEGLPSPDASLCTPWNQQLSSRFAAAAVMSPDDCQTPAVSAKTIPDTVQSSQAAIEDADLNPDDGSRAASADACADNHPQQLVWESTVLSKQAERLADLHAHIITGKRSYEAYAF